MDRVRRALNDDDDLVKVGYAAAVGIIAGALGPWYSLPRGRGLAVGIASSLLLLAVAGRLAAINAT